MNKWTGTGRLTRDNDLSYSTSGTAYLKNGIAVDRRGEGTDFFNITVFGKSAEAFDRYMKKGSKVIIEGHLQSDSYTNKEGKKVTSVSIIVDEWEFGEGKKDSGDTQNATPDFLNVADNIDDLPFN